ncbi:hypothetical protein BGZ99_001940, partial [Dissophora globulifera]
VVDDADGHFSEEEGRVRVKISSRALAKQFYAALVNAHVVQELDIALQWDVTLDDLWAFTDAVTKAYIINLRLDGSHFEGGPVLDTISHNCQYDPLVVLMSNMQIQVLHFEGITDLYQHLSSSTWSLAPCLRVLGISSKTSEYPLCVNPTLLSHILRNCVGLVELQITVNDLHLPYALAFQGVASALQMKSSLNVVKIRSKQEMVQYSVIQDHITNITMRIQHLFSLESLDNLLMRHITTLDVCLPTFKGYSQEDQRCLVATVQAAQALTSLVLTFYADQFTSILNSVNATREKGQAEGLSYEPLVVRFLGRDPPRGLETMHVLTARLPSHYTVARGISIDIHASPRYSKHASDTFGRLIRQHGSSIQEIGHDFVLLDDNARLLDEETGKNGSNLVYLELDPSRLSHSGLDYLDRVIARSARLQQLGFFFTRLEEPTELIKAVRLLGHYRAIVHSIRVVASFGNHINSWLFELQNLCPTKASLPMLETLMLCDSQPKHASSVLPCIPWVSAMVFASPQLRASISAQQSLAIKSLSLCNLVLNSDDWDIVFSVLSFLDLQELDLKGSNITMTHLELLVGRIPTGDDVVIPLTTLNVMETELANENFDRKLPGLLEVVKRLRAKAPLVEIVGVSCF